MFLLHHLLCFKNIIWLHLKTLLVMCFIEGLETYVRKTYVVMQSFKSMFKEKFKIPSLLLWCYVMKLSGFNNSSKRSNTPRHNLGGALGSWHPWWITIGKKESTYSIEALTWKVTIIISLLFSTRNYKDQNKCVTRHECCYLCGESTHAPCYCSLMSKLWAIVAFEKQPKKVVM